MYPGIFECWRSVYPVSFDAHGENAWIRCHRIHSPWNSDGLHAATCASACAARAQDGVGHAAIVIQNDVFDLTNFLALCSLHFSADKLAGLDVSSAGAGCSLGLSGNWRSGHTQDG